MKLKDLDVADWGVTPEDLNFREVNVTWTPPTPWKAGARPSLAQLGEQPYCLYLILKNHHRATQPDRIRYVGITQAPGGRYTPDHPGARIANERGETSLSFGKVTLHGRGIPLRIVRDRLEQIEHVLIWALDAGNSLENKAKMNSLPDASVGLDIHNRGYDFHGRVPPRIIYPWMVFG